MHHLTPVSVRFNRVEEALCWTAGLAFTFTLFFGLAHIETISPSPVVPAIEDLRVVSLPLDSPPPLPRTEETRPPPEDVPAFAGLEMGASDSPVRIAVVPPDLEALVPVTHEPPRALVSFNFQHPGLKPRMDAGVDLRHVYQVSEVDQAPQAVVRVAPPVPSRLFGNSHNLRVELLLLIDEDGRAVNVRVVRSSGQPEFDDIIVQTVKDRWEFSPAIRRGKRVKCLAQQSFRVTLDNSSPFELP